MNFSVKDGTIINSDEYEKEIENNAMLESGRYFTDKEYRNGEKVAICWDYLHWNTMSSPVSSRMAVDKNTLHIQGKDYKIIAYGIIDVDRPTIPVTSLEDTTLFHQRLVFHFKKPIRQEQYNLVVEKTNKIDRKKEHTKKKNSKIYLHISFLGKRNKAQTPSIIKNETILSSKKEHMSMLACKHHHMPNTYFLYI